MNCTCPNCGYEIKETTQESSEDVIEVIKVYQFSYEKPSGATSISSLWYDSDESFHDLNPSYSALRRVAMKTIKNTELHSGGWAY